MKVKLLDRLILNIGAVLAILAGIAVGACGVLLHGIELGEGLVMQALPMALICIGAFIAVIGILFLLVARHYAARRKAFIKQRNEMGELRIAVSAIENLIQKCLASHKEVKVEEMTLSNHRSGIDIALRVSMNSNVSIPHAVELLQTQIKRYLAASSGIEVHNITVSVDKTPDAPLPETEPLPEGAEPAPEKCEEKIPMHQRIFGRDPEKSEEEQVKESEMIMPPEVEAPAEETEEAVRQPAEQKFEPQAEQTEEQPADPGNESEEPAAEEQTVEEASPVPDEQPAEENEEKPSILKMWRKANK